MATTLASWSPSTNLSCGNCGTASMIASSVVPGLPKRCVMPSSARSCRKALRPVTFMRAASLDDEELRSSPDNEPDAGGRGERAAPRQELLRRHQERQQRDPGVI